MGSFNIGCIASNISIGAGEDVVVFPMVSSIWDHGNDNYPSYSDDTLICSNSGPHHFFTPFLFPFYAKYDDYGSVECVVRDTNTDVIEKYFECDIETFAKAITWKGKRDTKDYPEKLEYIRGLNACMVFADVYDAYTNQYEERAWSDYVRELPEETRIEYGYQFKQPSKEEIEVLLKHSDVDFDGDLSDDEIELLMLANKYGNYQLKLRLLGDGEERRSSISKLFIEIYKDSLISDYEFFMKRSNDQWKFNRLLFSTCRMYVPSYMSTQCGEPNHEKFANEVFAKIINRKLEV